jgi:hypothetical protein
LTILAVRVSVIVTGAGPQSNVITPPEATAATTAADVQPAGLPVPITRSGWEVSTPRASSGAAAPPGLAAGRVGLGVRGAATIRPADGSGGAGGRDVAGTVAGTGLAGGGVPARSATGVAGEPQAASAPAPTITRHTRRNRTAGR